LLHEKLENDLFEFVAQEF